MNSSMIIYKNRIEAGQLLAEKLKDFENENPCVVAIPRGGVPVAIEVAKILQAPLYVIGVKKVAAPLNPDLGIAAVVEDGTYVMNRMALNVLGLTDNQIHESIQKKREESRSNGILYRRGKHLPSFEGRTVIVVDDGLATGVTALSIAKFLRSQRARKIVFATPVCSPESAKELLSQFNNVLCVSRPYYLEAVGSSYANFLLLSDEDVVVMLRDYERQNQQKKEEISIDLGSVALKAIYQVPRHSRATIIFAHGSGSSRFSPRNLMVAKKFYQAGFATLLVDLLTEYEAKISENVFDISLLSGRVSKINQWVSTQNASRHLIGYFGASTGAAAAFDAAAKDDNLLAVVSRGGRPDLSKRLSEVIAPTLLIVGGDDYDVLELNNQAMRHLKNAKFEVIPSATHLFEEEGALDQVAALAISFFKKQLRDRLRESVSYAY